MKTRTTSRRRTCAATAATSALRPVRITMPLFKRPAVKANPAALQAELRLSAASIRDALKLPPEARVDIVVHVDAPGAAALASRCGAVLDSAPQSHLLLDLTSASDPTDPDDDTDFRFEDRLLCCTPS